MTSSRVRISRSARRPGAAPAIRAASSSRMRRLSRRISISVTFRRLFSSTMRGRLDEHRLAGAGGVVHDAQAHRLERRLQRQHEAILAQGDVFVLQVGRVLLRAHQLLGLLAHPGRQLVALAPQPEQLGRGAVAQLAGGVEGVAGVEHDAPRWRPARRRWPPAAGAVGPAATVAGIQAREPPAHVDRHLALVGHLAQLLGPQRNAPARPRPGGPRSPGSRARAAPRPPAAGPPPRPRRPCAPRPRPAWPPAPGRAQAACPGPTGPRPPGAPAARASRGTPDRGPRRTVAVGGGGRRWTSGEQSRFARST